MSAKAAELVSAPASLVILPSNQSIQVRVLLLDNFDSFTWNIVHYLEAMDVVVTVRDNHRVTKDNVANCDRMIVSPGPGLPSESGKLMEMLNIAVELGKPILGICLGMQAIAEHFGGRIYNQQEVKHGRQEKITADNGSVLFNGIPESFNVGLYHSWAVDEDLPESLKATAFSESGIMMALEHINLPVHGVQFHPESILSEYGREILSNFLVYANDNG